MTFYYTARATYDKDYDEDGMSWGKYIKWSRLEQLQELISVDGVLNEVLVNPNRDNKEDWKYIVVDEYYETGFYTSLEYVLEKMERREKFNLLAVVVNPEIDCKNVALPDFEFVGYDLLDYAYDISALSNCGGFDETFLPTDLNQSGLIDDYQKAFDIKLQLLENNPEEHHADTNVIAIWRHKAIGRTKLNTQRGVE
jgi:hypothetical protein